MKNAIKIALVVVAILGSTTALFAQKFGSVNTQEILMVMPETHEMQKQLDAFVKDLQNNLETIQVELNTKSEEYQKSEATLAESVRAMKQKELEDLYRRASEFETIARQDIEKKNAELFAPIAAKAREAISKVAKAAGYAGIFDITLNTFAYVNEAEIIDITADVRKELGISETAVPVSMGSATAAAQ